MDKPNSPDYTKEVNPSKQNDAKIDEKHYRSAHKHITRHILNQYKYIFLM